MLINPGIVIRFVDYPCPDVVTKIFRAGHPEMHENTLRHKSYVLRLLTWDVRRATVNCFF